jgi:DNA-binding transcriptional LysR family regulator
VKFRIPLRSKDLVEIKNVLEVGTCDAILEFVRRNIGIGFVHDICFPKNGAKDIRSYDMENELGTIEVSLVYKESIRSQPSYQALIDSFCKPRRKQK